MRRATYRWNGFCKENALILTWPRERKIQGKHFETLKQSWKTKRSEGWRWATKDLERTRKAEGRSWPKSFCIGRPWILLRVNQLVSLSDWPAISLNMAPHSSEILVKERASPSIYNPSPCALRQPCRSMRQLQQAFPKLCPTLKTKKGRKFRNMYFFSVGTSCGCACGGETGT